EAVQEIQQEQKEAADPTDVLNEIHYLISNGTADKQCDIPVAVCISKSDTEIQDVLDPELCSKLMEEVEGIKDRTGHGMNIFNATQYNPIAEGLWNFMMNNEAGLEQMLYNNYSAYNYFAFTALGCDVEDGKPVGPILPKRIEEPLFWMFNQFGYIGENEPVFQPGTGGFTLTCPECGSDDVEELPEEERLVVTGGFFRKKKEYFTHK